MIHCIEALRYRCFQHIRQKVDSFQILVGANASGKSTFLDTVRFTGQLISENFEYVIKERTDNLQDLLWKRSGDSFQIAIEMLIPESKRALLKSSDYDVCRYELGVGIDQKTGENSIFNEKMLLMVNIPENERDFYQVDLFPQDKYIPETILKNTRSRGTKTVVNKVRGGNDNFYDETGKGWDHSFKLGPQKSALANLPEDETKFPVATWMKRILSEGVDTIALNSQNMRKPSPPGQRKGFKPDGSNMPWVIESLRKRSEEEFTRWISHVKTALPDLKTIKTVERPEDRHRYLVAIYNNGLEVPSWSVSDGTLRLLALTLLAYAGGTEKIYLVEEPENGIHPQAVETVFQSLSSAYDSQVLCASHSPVVLSLSEPRSILCFAKTGEGSVDIVRGDKHPVLRNWKRGADLGTLFASGVLGG